MANALAEQIAKLAEVADRLPSHRRDFAESRSRPQPSQVQRERSDGTLIKRFEI